MAPNGGESAAVAVVKRSIGIFAPHPAGDQSSDILPLLLGYGSETRQWFSVVPAADRGIADDEDILVCRQAEVGPDFYLSRFGRVEIQPLRHGDRFHPRT